MVSKYQLLWPGSLAWSRWWDRRGWRGVQHLGVQVGAGPPRFELFVYVDDVDDTLDRLRDDGDVQVLKDPQDMFWGERVGWVADPDGNPVALAMGLPGASG